MQGYGHDESVPYA